MTPEIPPIVTEATGEQRRGERREGWHTPNDCFKLLDVQKTMDSIFGELADGKARMDCIEGKLDINNKATAELLEIIQTGKGFFRAVGWLGKWLRRIVMWLGPPTSILIGIWYAIKPPK